MNTEFSRRRLLQAAVAAGAASTLTSRAQEPAGAHLPQVTPAELKLDGKRVQVAYDLLKEWTTGPKCPVPGGAIIIGRNGKTLPPRFFGKQGPEENAAPLRRDAMFYMASVTKPVIYMAAMTLVERGKLNLSDRVSLHIPEFKGGDKELTQVLHLFTHSSGLPDELDNNTELRKAHAPLKKFIEECIAAKQKFLPGTGFSYSSAGTIIVAEIIQRISGKSIREFVKKEILDPLGLRSTGLGSQGLLDERIVRCTIPEYQVGGDYGWNSKYWKEFGSPTGGLFSTPEDYAVICNLMLNGGKHRDVRLLSPATIKMMTSNRYDDMPGMPEAVRRTQPWGLGWRLNHLGMPDSWSDLLDRKVFGHTGSSGNMVWMNPETQGFCIILTNYLRARAPWRLVSLSNVIASAFL